MIKKRSYVKQPIKCTKIAIGPISREYSPGPGTYLNAEDIIFF